MMNTTQRKYALERVNAIVSRKVREITDKHTTPEKSQTELVSAFRKGAVPLLGNSKLDQRNRGYTYLRDVFDLSAFSSKRDNKAIESETKKIAAEASNIRDQIMLGDATEALELLRAFDR